MTHFFGMALLVGNRLIGFQQEEWGRPNMIFDGNATLQSWSPTLMASLTETNIEELFPGYRKSCIIQVGGGESIGNSGKSLSFKDIF